MGLPVGERLGKELEAYGGKTTQIDLSKEPQGEVARIAAVAFQIAALVGGPHKDGPAFGALSEVTIFRDIAIFLHCHKGLHARFFGARITIEFRKLRDPDTLEHHVRFFCFKTYRELHIPFWAGECPYERGLADLLRAFKYHHKAVVTAGFHGPGDHGDAQDPADFRGIVPWHGAADGGEPRRQAWRLIPG